MIIYYITPFYKDELYKYGILNDTNFYLSCVERRVGFLGLGLRLGLKIQYRYHQIYFDKIQ